MTHARIVEDENGDKFFDIKIDKIHEVRQMQKSSDDACDNVLKGEEAGYMDMIKLKPRFFNGSSCFFVDYFKIHNGCVEIKHGEEHEFYSHAHKWAITLPKNTQEEPENENNNL